MSTIKSETGVLGDRPYYKPFQYDQFFDYFKQQQQAHWLPNEVPMADDVLDFRSKLSSAEKNLIIQVLRFFTQGDIEVQNNYNNELLKYFNHPEIIMMLNSFAAMEAVHVWAYSHLNDTLGLPEDEYRAFLEYDAMKAKYDWMQNFEVETKRDLALNLAVFGGFIEGISLFSSFAILMNFPRMGKLKNVGQIVTWSIRDEDLHSRAISELFNVMVQEDQTILDDEMVDSLTTKCRQMVELEDAFIDTCFAMGAVEGLTAEDVKKYIRYVANSRMDRIGLKSPYPEVTENPCSWLDLMITGKEHANFFETRATEYSKGTIIDDWGLI